MILIALGANLPSRVGPPAATFQAALARLGEGGEVVVAALSRLYQSPAWPNPDEPEYLNAVARLESKLSPQTLLARLHGIEAEFGRERAKPNAPRPLDLDLLDYDGLCLSGEIILPHPRLRQRAFVLLPLQDVAPDWRHPTTGSTLESLLAQLPKGHGCRAA